MYQKVVMGLLNGVNPNDNLHSAKNKEKRRSQIKRLQNGKEMF
jgi:hypothetical protein